MASLHHPCIRIISIILMLFYTSISANEFVVYTMPKTGTHLIIPLLETLTGKTSTGIKSLPELTPSNDPVKLEKLNRSKNYVQLHWLKQYLPLDIGSFNKSLNKIQKNNQFFARHVPYSLSMEDQMITRACTVFYIIRDPRDFIVSLLNHILNHGDILFQDEKWFRSLSRDKQIRTILLGTDQNNSAPAIIQRFYPWKDSPVCCVLQFEKLMGEKGGAYDSDTQLEELRKISDALSLDISDEQLFAAFNAVYGTSKNFHRGIAGAWKEYFNEENKQLCKQLLGEVIIALGYEQDYNW